MFIVDLKCENAHKFEGWYDSRQEFEDIRDSHDLSCPLCQSSKVEQWLSTGAIRTSKTEWAMEKAEEAQPPAEPHDESEETSLPMPVQRALSAYIQEIQRTHEGVGYDLCDEAIAMKEQTIPFRKIWGHATREQQELMQEKGVSYEWIPIPDIDKN